ncbi:MAG TPA: penicillin-insensitive murein endopeptidase, partial [Candidatus Omnitrophota bacterium]|nr:penicillin-insensitive murein endopeptidase [Candidatus Omnitrophota bacterium]
MRVLAASVGLSVLMLASACAQAGPAEQWSRIRVPAAGPVEAIGSPAAGCLKGAVALPPEGEGYQALRLERNRFYGHPRTVNFVRALGAAAKADGLGMLLIGDMSQPRGGPMAYGHGSHQTGLDVDVWFRLEQAPLPPEERERPSGVSMVKANAVNGSTWSAAHLRLLEIAATTPEVDRIFVNPAIKAAACREATGDRAWLGKLRPWWGHDEHFHVRLACPAGDAGCVPQAPVPEGDGCGGELASWSG